jgi:hypothetical protein
MNTFFRTAFLIIVIFSSGIMIHCTSKKNNDEKQSNTVTNVIDTPLITLDTPVAKVDTIEVEALPTVIINTPTRHFDKDEPESRKSRLVKDSFYEKIYWKYHCGEEAPKGTNFYLDESDLIFLSTNGNKKDCFIRDVFTGNCGVGTGSGGYGAVFFKRKPNGEYYSYVLLGAVGLKKLKTSHNGVYDLANFYFKSPVEYFCYWDGEEYNEIKTYISGVPTIIAEKLFGYNDSTSRDDYYFRKWDSDEGFECYEKFKIDEKTNGIIVAYRSKWCIFKHLGGNHYQYIQTWGSSDIRKIKTGKTKTNGIYDLKMDRREHTWVKKNNTILRCENVDVMTWRPEKRKYEFSCEDVDTCY